MRDKLILAALVSTAQNCAAKVDQTWLSSLNAAVEGQVQSQIQASIANAVPGILSTSAAAVIIQQVPTITAAAQPPAAPQVATQAAPAVIVAQPATQAVMVAAQPTTTQAAQLQVAAVSAASPAAAQGVTVMGDIKTAQAVAANNAASKSGSTIAGPIIAGAASVVATLSAGGLTTITTVANDISVSTRPDGSVVTLANVSSLPSSSSLGDSGYALLTNAQGSIINGTSTPMTNNSLAHVKTTMAGGSTLSGNASVHTKTGLSRSAAVGVGVGFASLALLLCGGFFAFRWWARRKQERKRHNRTPSIVISAPLQAEGPSESSTSRRKSTTNASSEVAGDGTIEMEHNPMASATLKSSRSPVSPWTPGSTGTGSSTPVAQPSIFELMGSDAIEMAGPVAAAEVAGSDAAKEVDGLNSIDIVDDGDENDKPKSNNRPFSFVQTPLEAFIPVEEGASKN